MTPCDACLQKAYQNLAMDGSQYYLGQELKSQYASNPPGGVSAAVGKFIDDLANEQANQLHSKGFCKPQLLLKPVSPEPSAS